MTKPEDTNAQHPEDGVVEGDDLLDEAAGGMNDHGYDVTSEGGWRV
jgi:hypothetical protein